MKKQDVLDAVGLLFDKGYEQAKKEAYDDGYSAGAKEKDEEIAAMRASFALSYQMGCPDCGYAPPFLNYRTDGSGDVQDDLQLCPCCASHPAVRVLSFSAEIDGEAL